MTDAETGIASPDYLLKSLGIPESKWKALTEKAREEARYRLTRGASHDTNDALFTASKIGAIPVAHNLRKWALLKAKIEVDQKTLGSDLLTMRALLETPATFLGNVPLENPLQPSECHILVFVLGTWRLLES